MSAEMVVVQTERGTKLHTAGGALVASLYQKYYGVQPPIPQHLLVAVQGGEVVATTAVEFAEAGRSLHLEYLYDLSQASLPWPLVSAKTAQLSRLSAAAPHGRAVVTWGAMLYALSRGCESALAEAKEKPAARHLGDGVLLHALIGARLRLERVEEIVKRYYTTPPAPVLFLMRLTEVRDSYAAHLDAAQIEYACDF